MIVLGGGAVTYCNAGIVNHIGGCGGIMFWGVAITVCDTKFVKDKFGVIDVCCCMGMLWGGISIVERKEDLGSLFLIISFLSSDRQVKSFALCDIEAVSVGGCDRL